MEPTRFAINSATYRARNPDRFRQIRRDSKFRKTLESFGVDEVWFDETLDAQAGVCAICSSSEWGRGRSRPAIDHDHVSGQARGLLCNRCNMAIGLMGDDPVLLRAALIYLETH